MHFNDNILYYFSTSVPKTLEILISFWVKNSKLIFPTKGSLCKRTVFWTNLHVSYLMLTFKAQDSLKFLCRKHQNPADSLTRLWHNSRCWLQPSYKVTCISCSFGTAMPLVQILHCVMGYGPWLPSELLYIARLPVGSVILKVNQCSYGHACKVMKNPRIWKCVFKAWKSCGFWEKWPSSWKSHRILLPNFVNPVKPDIYTAIVLCINQ